MEYSALAAQVEEEDLQGVLLVPGHPAAEAGQLLRHGAALQQVQVLGQGCRMAPTIAADLLPDTDVDIIVPRNEASVPARQVRGGWGVT